MNRILLGLALTGAVFLASPAQAVVTVNGTVPAGRADYIFFSFGGGDLSIATTGIGANPLSDPTIRLYLDNGSSIGGLTGTEIGFDDDSGPGMDPLLSLLGVSAGHYVLAVGSFFLDEDEARSGIASTPSSAETYSTTFTSRGNVTLGRNLLPEPGTWVTMLVGFGLAGAALRRERKAFALT